MDRSPHQSLEARLLYEIKEVKRRIEESQVELRTLERLLVRVRGQNLGNQDVTRKNSINRLLVEKAILDNLALRISRQVPLSRLLEAARSIIPDLKESTFRSHLNRLKLRGMISSPKHGKWQIVISKAPVTELDREGKS
jgi:hypothetical protein